MELPEAFHAARMSTWPSLMRIGAERIRKGCYARVLKGAHAAAAPAAPELSGAEVAEALFFRDALAVEIARSMVWSGQSGRTPRRRPLGAKEWLTDRRKALEGPERYRGLL